MLIKPIYSRIKMLNKLRFFTLSLLMTSFATYAAEQASSSSSSSNELRQVTSLIEAYMAGKLNAAVLENGDKIVTYVDYADASVTYVESVEKAYEELREIAQASNCKISNDNLFPIQMKLQTIQSSKIINLSEIETELNNLSEQEKFQLQMIRLSDFQKNRNNVLSKNTESQLEQIVSDSSLTDEQKEEQINAILDEAKIEELGVNRKALATALKEGNVQAINVAQQKPFHLTAFVSLNESIQKLIANVNQRNEGVNTFIDHSSRAEACSIM